jgi:hypothetical protein
MGDGFYADFLNNAAAFGIVRNLKADPNFSNFSVVPGTTSGTVKILNGVAYDVLRNRILFATTDNFAIPNDSNNYFLKIAFNTSVLEQGTVSISTSGVLTGVGTSFTTTLRGQPNFPSVVSFPNAVSNLQTYEVLSVTSDTSAMLQGVFTIAETSLNYSVVGTFTPGVYPPTQNEYPFQYDSCTLTLVAAPTTGFYPTLIKDQEFIIAMVSNTGGTVAINDARMDFLYKTKADFDIKEMPVQNVGGYWLQTPNPLIAVTFVKGFLVNNLQYYQVGFDWKFTIATKTVNRNNSTITILSGNGGSYIDITSVMNNDFNGWRLYYGHSGDYMTIINTTIVGGYPVIQVDSIAPTVGGTPELNNDEMYICPNAEEIEIFYQIPNSNTATLYYKTVREVFKITCPSPQTFIRGDELFKSIITLPTFYNYKTFVKQPNYNLQFNSNYYLAEPAFDLDGNLVDPTKVNQASNIVIGGLIASGFLIGALEAGSSSVGVTGSTQAIQIN